MFEKEAKKIVDIAVEKGPKVEGRPASTYRMMEEVIIDAFKTKNIMFHSIVVDVMVQLGLETTAVGHRIIEKAIAENA